MKWFKSRLPYVLFAVSSVLELLLITSVANSHLVVSNGFGPWALNLSGGLEGVISWTVVIFLAFSFVMFFGELQFWGMLATMVMIVLVELLWGRVLPSPQNRWDLALAFVAGAFMMFLVALSRTEFIENAKAKLRPIWST
jgi:hypothetical protein